MSLEKSDQLYDGGDGRFNITIQARILHGVLWAARQRMGSNKRLADHLGLSQGCVGRWLALKGVPSQRLRNSARWQATEKKLMELTGQSVDELFPQALSSNDFLDRPKTIEQTRGIPMSMLSGTALAPQALPLPDEILEWAEEQAGLSCAIASALTTLTPREQRILTLRYGLSGGEPQSLEQVGDCEHVGKERIRQIEVKALRKLRHPTRSRKLTPFADY